jgi:hypothetical protein
VCTASSFLYCVCGTNKSFFAFAQEKSPVQLLARVNFWNKKYQIVVAGTSEVLVVHPKEATDGKLAVISCLVMPSY